MFHKRFLKKWSNCQSEPLTLVLPERAFDIGAYILPGEISIAAELGKKILTQLVNMLGDENVVKEIMRRQLAIKDDKSRSWFYGLHPWDGNKLKKPRNRI